MRRKNFKNLTKSRTFSTKKIRLFTYIPTAASDLCKWYNFHLFRNFGEFEFLDFSHKGIGNYKIFGFLH